jgi:hypothetical protein
MEKAIEKGEKFIAAESVGYSMQSVISRQVLKNEKGSITLFAFDSGEGLSEHTAPFDAEDTSRAYLANAPRVYFGAGACHWPSRRCNSSSRTSS